MSYMPLAVTSSAASRYRLANGGRTTLLESVVTDFRRLGVCKCSRRTRLTQVTQHSVAMDVDTESMDPDSTPATATVRTRRTPVSRDPRRKLAGARAQEHAVHRGYKTSTDNHAADCAGLENAARRHLVDAMG